MQALLALFGVFGKISLGRKADVRAMPDGRGGIKDYECQDCYRLTVSNAVRFLEVFYPERVTKGAYTIQRSIHVVSVEPLAQREPVYCCGVATTGSFDLPTVHSGNCAEILLGDKGFCNLAETNLPRFNGDREGLHVAARVIARANYRQTCVELRDGVLQDGWHELNQFLRLCGAGVTGVVMWDGADDKDAWAALRKHTVDGANSMADELGLPRPQATTTLKPSGTLGKVMDTPEGLHRPMGRFIFNNVGFSSHDPIVKKLRRAGYAVSDHPVAPGDVLVRLPVRWDGVAFQTDAGGRAINSESALDQLRRYLMVMDHYVDHNASITVSYDKSEVGGIADWIHRHWDRYVGVSFLPRLDPTKTAADLGFQYLPQQVVTQDEYESYVAGIRPVNLDEGDAVENALDESQLSIDAGDECATGACPVR